MEGEEVDPPADNRATSSNQVQENMEPHPRASKYPKCSSAQRLQSENWGQNKTKISLKEHIFKGESKSSKVLNLF